MAKMRIHEFAKELDMPGKDVITILEKLGEIGKTVSSSIDDELQDKVRKHMSRGDNAMKTDKPVKAEEKPAPAGPAEAYSLPGPRSRPFCQVLRGHGQAGRIQDAQSGW